jgi:hypothetical protein
MYAILLSIDEPEEDNPAATERPDPEKWKKYKTPTATKSTMFRIIEIFFILGLKFQAANITILSNLQGLNR